MLFVVIGVVVIALNLLGIGPPGHWNWAIFGDLWKFTVPFLLAVIWWAWSDKSGRDKRREVARMDAKKEKRRREQLGSLGLDSKRGKR